MDNTTNTVSVERVIELQSKLDSKQKELDQANQTIGSNEAHIITLEDQIRDLENKQPLIKVIKETRKPDGWGHNYPSYDTEYRNLDSVKLELEEKIKKEYKDELNKVKTELTEVKTLKDSAIKNFELQYKLSSEENSRMYDSFKNEKNLEIKKLKDEIKSIKEDKTNEQLEKLRQEELDLLKEQLNVFKSLNWFKRIFYAITGNITAAVAEVKLQNILKEEEKLRNNRRYSNLYTSFNW